MAFYIANGIVSAVVLLSGGELSLHTALPNGIVPTAFDGVVVVSAGDEQGIGEQNSVFTESHVWSL